jgi:hypothetical protein
VAHVNSPPDPTLPDGAANDATATEVRLVWASAGHRPGGTWWPRTRDARTELGTVLAEVGEHMGGAVDRVSLNIDAWDADQPQRMRVGDRLVRLGWFRTMDPATITLGSGSDPRLTLRLIPPELEPGAAHELLVDASRSTT